ncbi:MAG: hypothetical protein IKH81_01285 [Clostridia bacterium]|nr:hypothetical protein [Clostridia bacterium]MBR6965704.1 hypothetical protein [Clostridia bacterium]
MKRFTALILAILMILSVTSALADSWKCPDCGATNDGKFCSNCGAKKPGENNYQVGEYVSLGRWEQNGDSSDGAEKIWWVIIDKKGDKLFLLSHKALANLPFNKTSNKAAWGSCSLRKWLNNDFYTSAFNKDERAAIQTTKVQDNKEHTYYEWNTKGRLSGTTEDKVFLLSFLEVRTLLNNKTIWCQPTAVVANKKIRSAKGYCAYWLRTSAYKNNAGVVWYDGNFTTAYEHNPYYTVRPALWVEASAVKGK